MKFTRFFSAALVAFALLLSVGGMYSVRAAGKNQDGQAAPTAKPATFRYVCPMHEDVQSRKPGKCPKCKMKLEKTKVKEPEAKPPDQ